MSKFLLVVVLVGILALTSVFVLFKFTNTSPTPKTNGQTTNSSQQPSSSSSPTSTTKTNQSPKGITQKDTQNAIIAAMNKEDRSALLPFFQKTDVAFALYASDCCPPQSAEDALKQLVFVNAGMPLTFDQENTAIKNLKTKNPQIADSFIGISTTNEYLVAFTIDDKTHLIKAIQMSVSYKLYTQ